MIWKCETSIHKPEYDFYPVNAVYDPTLKVRGMCTKCQEVALEGTLKILYQGKTAEQVMEELK